MPPLLQARHDSLPSSVDVGRRENCELALAHDHQTRVEETGVREGRALAKAEHLLKSTSKMMKCGKGEELCLGVLFLCDEGNHKR